MVRLPKKAVTAIYALSNDRMGNRSTLITDEEKIFLKSARQYFIAVLLFSYLGNRAQVR